MAKKQDILPVLFRQQGREVLPALLACFHVINIKYMRVSFTSAALLLILVLFVWAGMLLSISFMEAPLKFTAPHITLPLGLSVGRVVFAALNRGELLLGVLALACGLRLHLPGRLWAGVLVVFFILLVQSFWLLPLLDERSLEWMSGLTPPVRSLSALYMALEAVKLVGLLVTGSWVFSWILQTTKQQQGAPPLHVAR